MMRAGDVVIVAIIVTFGTAVVGGNAIGENLIQFNYMPGMGVDVYKRQAHACPHG